MNLAAFVLSILAIVLTIVDALQTLFIASNPLDDYHEQNTVLGLDPTPRHVVIYFSICCALELAAAVLLWDGENNAVLIGAATALTLIEGFYVLHNWRTGIRI